jgi:hypothetical protein
MAETDWSAPSDWGGQAGGMFGQTQSAMGWGGGYGMPQQSPWSSPYSGFGGGMGYGGGGGMQSPYGAPMGMGSYSPQAYGMQSMGAPQQQAMMAAAPQAGTNQMVPSPNLPAQSSSWEDILKNIPGIGDNKGGLFGGNQKIEQTFNPWAPQGAGLQDLYKKANAEYDAQRKLGAPQFAQESQYALNRMEDVAKGKNPLVAQSRRTASRRRHVPGSLQPARHLHRQLRRDDQRPGADRARALPQRIPAERFGSG